MTIKPGEPWGRTIERPVDLIVVAGDPELVVAAWEATLPVHARHEGDRILISHR